ncbi:MAG: hypothetical protein JWN50_466 [Parcubacteria group bacterium]|nr:hypothetical protein [Parcubacteria group bacterium]
MPTGQTVLVRCKKCQGHGHWIFADGSMSEEFHSLAQGALHFMRAVAEKKASSEEIPSALRRLETITFISIPKVVVVKVERNEPSFPMPSIKSGANLN